MARDTHIYGEIDSETNLRKVFRAIRREAKGAASRPALTELYRRAGYLITLTHAPSWEAKFGKSTNALRHVGMDEFRNTAEAINRRAARIGTEPNFDYKSAERPKYIEAFFVQHRLGCG